MVDFVGLLSQACQPFEKVDMMSIPISQIRFGEFDAKNELFQQEREESKVFLNAFQVPPGINLDSLLAGSKYFITGQKGSGKTALIWYLMNRFSDAGGVAKVVLFKSDLTEAERQRLIKFTDTNIFSGQDRITIEYDYKQNWLWFIIRNIVRNIKKDDVVAGREYFEDLRILTGADSDGSSTVFSGLQFTKIKAAIEAGLKTGIFQSKIKGEIEGIF